MAITSENVLKECQQYTQFVLQNITDSINQGSKTSITDDPTWKSGVETTYPSLTPWPTLTPTLVCGFSETQLTFLRKALNEAQMTIEDVTKLIEKINNEALHNEKT